MVQKLRALMLYAVVPLWLASSANAVAIQEGDFTSSEVQTYLFLGLPFRNATPLVIGPNTFETDSGVIRYIRDAALANDAADGYIEIMLGEPAEAAGVLVGSGSPTWSVTVSFFEDSFAIGEVIVSGTQPSLTFAGWRSDSGLISRIRMASDGPQPFLQMSRLTTGTAIPEPASATLVAMGLALLCLYRR